jgi:hypothetical protein
MSDWMNEVSFPSPKPPLRRFFEITSSSINVRVVLFPLLYQFQIQPLGYSVGYIPYF